MRPLLPDRTSADVPGEGGKHALDTMGGGDHGCAPGFASSVAAGSSATDITADSIPS